MGDPLQRIHDFRTEPLLSNMRLALVGLKNNAERLHLGILFWDGEVLRLLHLKWHHKVHSEPASSIKNNEKLFWIELGLDELEEDHLLGRFRAIARQNRGSYSIAYGFSHTDGHFAADGTFESGQDCGLTCATFVLAAFALGEHPLLDTQQWPKRSEDIPFQQEVFDRLRNSSHYPKYHPDFPQYVEKLKQEVGSPRFRPEEVAAAGAAPEHPAGFKYCEKQGRELIKRFLPREEEDGHFLGWLKKWCRAFLKRFLPQP